MPENGSPMSRSEQRPRNPADGTRTERRRIFACLAGAAALCGVMALRTGSRSSHVPPNE
jgi:hypothetical protein